MSLLSVAALLQQKLLKMETWHCQTWELNSNFMVLTLLVPSQLPQGKLLAPEWLLCAMFRNYLIIKVSLASDFMYNYMSRDVTASVGYDYILRQGDQVEDG